MTKTAFVQIHQDIDRHGMAVVDLSKAPKGRNMTYAEVKAMVKDAPRAAPWKAPVIRIIPKEPWRPHFAIPRIDPQRLRQALYNVALGAAVIGLLLLATARWHF